MYIKLEIHRIFSMGNERLSFKIDFAIIISVNLQHMEICLVDVNLDR
jgi:hypothetical protein